MQYTTQEEQFFLSKGGKIIPGDRNLFKGEREREYNFGLIVDKDIDLAIREKEIKQYIPVYQLPTRGAAGDKWCAWWPAMKLKAPGKVGNHFLTFDQKTGSCVGNGAGQAVRYRNAFEVYAGDLDKVIVPFWLICYGKSREFAGMNNRGDGSLGSTMAKAMKEIGMSDAELPMFPRWDEQGGVGMTWGSGKEYDYSVGRSIPADQLADSKNHLILDVQQIPSLDALEAAILIDGCTATCASNWGGKMQCPTEGGDEPVLLNSRQGVWQHQMCILACWIHRTLGRIWYILNSWSIRAHGTPPDDSPAGGFWVKDRDMQHIVSQDEVFAIKNYRGVKLTDLSAIEIQKLRKESEKGYSQSRKQKYFSRN